ncbi:MAG: arsenite methyltransferase [Bacteroidota bacterium]
MSDSQEQLKELVREKYGQISEQSRDQNATSACGCGPACCGPDTDNAMDYTVMAESYDRVEGYVQEADLGLGCGLPTEFAQLSEGLTVVDLGSGAGNDAFIARQIVGESGQVIGIDFTPKMIEKARVNAEKLGYSNVSFVEGDIEEMPLEEQIADVVVSNCVMNLVPDKQKAFAETYRIMKTGGHFSISDIVLQGDLPDQLKEDAEMYAGCVSGAIQKDEYLGIIEEQGFRNITIQKFREIELPDNILLRVMSEEEIEDFRASDTGIYSMSVYAEK